MATIDTFITTRPSVQKLGTDVVKDEITLDFSATGATTSDTVGAIRLPAGAIVQSLYARVKTAEGGTATIDIGIRGGTATQFFSNLDANAVALTASSSPAYVNTSGAEEIIEIAPDNDLDTAVVQLFITFGVSELTL